jgi:N-acetylglucosamine-6-phosphate deacetylase
MEAYSADKIFTGKNWLHSHSIIVDNGCISDIIPTHFVPSIFPIHHYSKCFIAPAFIDLQIYGAMGSLFSVHPSANTLHKMYDHCVSGGTKYFLPTVATNTFEVFKECIDAVKSYWGQGGKGVPGLHIEGPWLNKEKRGAHIESLIHSPEVDEVKELLEYGKGVIRIITLAPEVCSKEVIRLIQSYGIIISAGHSNATYKEATNAFNNGIQMATHLYNAMSALQHREPGLAGAIMQHPTVWSSIIPDGHHVDFAALSIAKNVMGARLFIITDAVTETSEGPYPHQLDGDKYIANGILSGSALTMNKGVKNCVEHAGIELAEALRMASLYPAKVLGLDNELGRLERGYKADFVILNKELEVV